MARVNKSERHKILLQQVKENPFLTDEELAHMFEVSIPTIRLDRMKLGIPEVRERIRQVAENTREKLTDIDRADVVGEVIDLERGKSGISLLRITDDMVFSKTGIAKGYFVFAQANSLALALADDSMAVTGVANLKYNLPVKSGDMLVARAEVIRRRDNKVFIWVKTRNDSQEVFRAKFIVVSMEKD